MGEDLQNNSTSSPGPMIDRRHLLRGVAVAGAAASGAVAVPFPVKAEEAPLILERKISLGDVRGRIDHLAVDLQRNRLFVAELENNSVGIIDLGTGTVRHVIAGMRGPQGLGYHGSTDTRVFRAIPPRTIRVPQGAARAGRSDRS